MQNLLNQCFIRVTCLLPGRDIPMRKVHPWKHGHELPKRSWQKWKREEEEPPVLAGPSKARLFLSSRKQVKGPTKQNRVSFKPKCLRFVADVREWNARLECIYLNTSVCGEPSRVESSEHIADNLFDFFFKQTSWNHLGIQSKSLDGRNYTSRTHPHCRCSQSLRTFLVWLLLKFSHLIMRPGMYQVARVILFI